MALNHNILEAYDAVQQALATYKAELQAVKSGLSPEECIELYDKTQALNKAMNQFKFVSAISVADRFVLNVEIAEACLDFLQLCIEESDIESGLGEYFSIKTPLTDFALPSEAILSFTFTVNTEYASDDEGGTMTSRVVDPDSIKIEWDQEILSALFSKYVDFDSDPEGNPIESDNPETVLVRILDEALVVPMCDLVYDFELNYEKVMNGAKRVTINSPVASMLAHTK